MAVNIQGDAGRGVAHEVLHAFDIQPAADQAGAEGMAQDVRGEGGDGDTAALGVAPMDIAEDAVSVVIAGATLYIPFAELVDIAQEIARLEIKNAAADR